MRPTAAHDRILRLAGAVVVVISLGFCVHFAIRHASRLPAVDWSWTGAAAFAGALALYLLSQLLLAEAWRRLLAAAGRPLPFAAVAAAFLTAQIGKYLPGNVAQYAGRVEILRRLGATRSLTAATLLFETASLIATALAVVAAALLLDPRDLPAGIAAALPYRRLALAALLLALALAVVGALLHRRRDLATLASLPSCAALHAAFFVLNGWGLAVLATGLFGVEDPRWGWLIGLFAAAWVAGFVTPGAPAGLGVRDLLVLTVLGALYDPGVAVALAAAHRLVTTLGDGLAFLLGLAGRRHLSPAGSSTKS